MDAGLPRPPKSSCFFCGSITGRIHYTRWTDQQNIERFGVEIIADEVTFLSYGKSRQQQQAGSQDNEDDDIPF